MRSIGHTITIATILTVGLILAASQIVIDGVVSNWLLQKFDTALESKARALVTLTKYDGSEVELDFADEFMPEFEAPTNPEFFELFLGNGSLLERSNSFDEYERTAFNDQDDEVLFTDVQLPDGRQGRLVSIKFIPQIENKALRKEIPLENRPRAILRVSRERESLDESRSQFHLLIISSTLVTLLAVALGVSRIIKRGLKPLIQIKNDISQISPNSIDRRIATGAQPLELEPIANQFNLVLAEIEKAFVRERQFSSDVAHELRTPVAEIRSLAEVGLRWPDEKDIRSYFADIHESSRHLDRLIENLLHLCRSEEGNIELKPERIELDKLIDKICHKFVDEMADKNLEIAISQGDIPVITADEQWIELIALNLIYNAISHSTPGATININVTTDGNRCKLEVVNPMLEPLSDQDLEMIFRRFWRKDKAREIGRHAGIGLALVKSYADLMQLEVAAFTDNSGRYHIQLSNIRIA